MNLISITENQRRNDLRQFCKIRLEEKRREEKRKEPAHSEFKPQRSQPSKAFGVTQSSQRLIRKVGQSVKISINEVNLSKSVLTTKNLC